MVFQYYLDIILSYKKLVLLYSGSLDAIPVLMGACEMRDDMLQAHTSLLSSLLDMHLTINYT